MATNYKAFCGPFAVVDKCPERAKRRAIADLVADCGGTVMPGSWADERIAACLAREPELVAQEVADQINARNWSAWATHVIHRQD